MGKSGFFKGGSTPQSLEKNSPGFLIYSRLFWGLMIGEYLRGLSVWESHRLTKKIILAFTYQEIWSQSHYLDDGSYTEHCCIFDKKRLKSV
jgi:hypothetical protein